MFWETFAFTCFILIMYLVLLMMGHPSTWRKRVYPIAFLFSTCGALALFGFVHTPPVMIGLGLGYIALSLLLVITEVNVSKAIIASLALFITIWGGFSLYVYSGILEEEKYRERFPYVSLADRLAYEDEMPFMRLPDDISTINREDESETPAAERFKAYSWSTCRHSERASALVQVHWDSIDKFVHSPGFGEIRMIFFSPELIDELKDPEPIPLPDRYVLRKNPSETLQELLVGYPQDDQLWSVHVDSAGDFVNRGSNGYAQDRDHVAGFLSHGFRELPVIESSKPDVSFDEWKLVQLQLVSLLKHGEPVVYNSSELPRMDGLKDAGTRSLTEFEQSALTELCAGEDLVIQNEADSIRMVGSLRAVRDCLDCHRGEEGQLLGAFTYEFILPHGQVNWPQQTVE